ncbi:BrnT family toxin [Mannheimia sp. AT1]|uniref:BrnT family toxin n=1 Tax=Mannheimia cairinae TaxID=3025936 RepID=A0ABT5MQJ7_9PAST|nr:BrnT family toxin [Mannheimia cairinae]MDD0824463.1 BrnT family toxin [Mannheimia cairinae]MDD0825564.1 BrnT family toxin [Mannheimia cairinae]
MELEYDEQKSEKNRIERGLPFSMVKDFEFDTAFIQQDLRYEYNEIRYRALGFIGMRLYAVVFCFRDKAVRVISFRKANTREVTLYEQNKTFIS